VHLGPPAQREAGGPSACRERIARYSFDRMWRMLPRVCVGIARVVHESPPLDPAITLYSFTLPFPIVQVYGVIIGGTPDGGTERKKGYMLYAILATFLILSVISLISGHVASR
jgi:hypothetical protein